jgi:hypothetical protein
MIVAYTSELNLPDCAAQKQNGCIVAASRACLHCKEQKPACGQQKSCKALRTIAGSSLARQCASAAARSTLSGAM